MEKGVLSGQHETPQEFINQSEWNTKCRLNSSLGSSSIKNWRCISLCSWHILKLATSSCCKHLAELCGAFRRLSWGQPRVAEALCSSGPPLRMIIQHAKEEVWESRGFLQQEVVFLHQNVIQAPEPQWTDTTQVTWMWTQTVLHKDAHKWQLWHDLQGSCRLTSVAEVLCRVFTRHGDRRWDFTKQLYDLGYMVWGGRSEKTQCKRETLHHCIDNYNAATALSRCVSVGHLSVSARCTRRTFLQWNGLADFGFKQGVSSDQLKGLRECKRKLKV